VDIENLVAQGTGAPAGNAPHQFRVTHFEQHHRVERRAKVGHESGQRTGLGLSPRESVEDETILRVRLRHAVADDLEHGGVVDQQAFRHDGIRPLAELRALFAMLAQDVSGRDLRNSELLYETLGLSALARSGRAHENYSHARFDLDFLTRIF
jgi:hypothetical protein